MESSDWNIGKGKLKSFHIERQEINQLKILKSKTNYTKNRHNLRDQSFAGNRK